MKVIFMGTPDFSTGVLESIIEAGHEVTAVVTQPDKPKGRGHEMQFTPVKEVALKYNLPVLQPKKIRDPEVVAQLEEIPADICVVVAFGQIIPKSILEMKKYGCINVHASLLPAYRGAAPILLIFLLSACQPPPGLLLYPQAYRPCPPHRQHLPLLPAPPR